MTLHSVSMIWPDVPEAQRRCLIALLGQMATRPLATTLSREGTTYDCPTLDQRRSPDQDSGTAPRSPSRGVCAPIDSPAVGAPPGVDPAPIRSRGAGAGLRLGTA